MGKNLNDEELVRRIRASDEEALAAAMRKYSPGLLSVAFSVIRQRRDAEEVVQDVFLCLWRKPERFDSAKGPLLMWLVILTRSRALDRLRRVRAGLNREKELTPSVSYGPRAVVQTITFDQEIMIQEVLSRLPPKQGAVIKKAYFEGYALTEIAGLHQAPIGTIKGRARLALKNLRSQLRAK